MCERAKQLEVYNFLKEKNVHVAILQETNLNIKQEYSLKGLWEDANFILNCGPNQSGNGVAIVSLVPNIEMVHAFSDCNGKVMAVDIEMYQEKFNRCLVECRSQILI